MNDDVISIHERSIPQRRGDAEDCIAMDGVNRLINKDLHERSN